MIFQPIVEGQGDVAAVPVLLRRLVSETQAWEVGIARPHRRHRTELVKKDALQRAVKAARLTPHCAGILILFDADDDCPKEKAPMLEEWAHEAAGTTPCSVVMANREYEAWFLASIESLRVTGRILSNATAHPDPETPRDAKGQLKQRMGPDGRYSPTVDQASLTENLEFAVTYRSCRSFRKLVKAFGVLLNASHALPDPWPPAHWGQEK